MKDRKKIGWTLFYENVIYEGQFYRTVVPFWSLELLTQWWQVWFLMPSVEGKFLLNQGTELTFLGLIYKEIKVSNTSIDAYTYQYIQKTHILTTSTFEKKKPSLQKLMLKLYTTENSLNPFLTKSMFLNDIELKNNIWWLPLLSENNN